MSGQDSNFLKGLHDADIDVELTVEENDPVYRSRIDAIRRFYEIFKGRIPTTPEHSARVRVLGEFVIGCEHRSGQSHALYKVHESIKTRLM